MAHRIVPCHQVGPPKNRLYFVVPAGMFKSPVGQERIFQNNFHLFALYVLHGETYVCTLSKVKRCNALFCLSTSHKIIMDGLVMPCRANTASVFSTSKPSA
eukprot:6184335-Pleurochrysis_carterae.AAC.2